MFAQSVTSLRLLLKTDLARRVTLFNGTYSARVSNMPRDQNSLHPSGPSDVTVLAMASTSLRLAVGGGWGVSAGYPAPLPASRFLCMNVPLTPCVGRGRGGCPRGGSGARGASAQGAFRDEPFVDHGVGGWGGGIEWVDLRNCFSTCNQPPRTCCRSQRSSGDRRVRPTRHGCVLSGVVCLEVPVLKHKPGDGRIADGHTVLPWPLRS